MLVAGAVEVDGGSPRRARLKMIEGFDKGEVEQEAKLWELRAASSA